MKPKDAFGRYGCVPRDLHPAWLEVSWSARAIGMALFSLIDDFETRRVDIHGDWMDSVCKRLAIGGKERRFVKPALRSLEEGGLLTVHSTFIVVNTTPADSGRPFKSTQVPENTQVTKDSKLAIKASKQADERVRAPERVSAPEPRPPIDTSKLQQRPEDVGFKFVASLLGRSPFDVAPVGSYPREYAWIGGRPPEERERIRAAVEAEQYFVENPAWCDAKKLQTDWPKLLAGRPRPLARAVAIDRREQLEKARERLRTARIEVNRLDGLPWFDREKPSWPGRREKAQAEVAAADAAVAELVRGGAQAVAS